MLQGMLSMDLLIKVLQHDIFWREFGACELVLWHA